MMMITITRRGRGEEDVMDAARDAPQITLLTRDSAPPVRRESC